MQWALVSKQDLIMPVKECLLFLASIVSFMASIFSGLVILCNKVHFATVQEVQYISKCLVYCYLLFLWTKSTPLHALIDFGEVGIGIIPSQV